MSGYIFVIEDIGSLRRATADKLSLTPDGLAKFWYEGKLVGVIKAESWKRIYVESQKPVAEAKS